MWTPVWTRSTDHGHERSDSEVMTKEELVGVHEIAERTHRSKQAVWNWTKYTHMRFPEPVARLAAGPVWRWSDIRRWLEERKMT